MNRVSRPLLGAIVVVIVGSASSAAARTLPPGFQPVSFTAVSERDFWLLGTAPCRGSQRCTAIVRTTDGGRSFDAVHAPALPPSGTTPELRFADRLDGFVFVPWRGPFYATHDGGASWRRLALGRVVGFATGAGTVFVVTSRSLEYSRVSANAWHAQPLPFSSDGSPLALAAHGASLWLLGTRPSAGPSPSDELARSNDAGRTFLTAAGPCVPGLGGELAPASTRVVWAVCPTGMLGAAWRSTNGGVSFVRLRTPQLVNAAQIAPGSESTAVLERGVSARLLRTTDGGKTWRATQTPGAAVSVGWVGFTDARVGAALVQTRTAATALWRTTDGGATWSNVRIG
ncbi:MAG: hypothetical protein E6G50_05005 [Actinobacteria bacterium]|nr:MAG: hypothetical protein E6G50_05005 [Actinomycetota bacterium]